MNFPENSQRSLFPHFPLFPPFPLFVWKSYCEFLRGGDGAQQVHCSRSLDVSGVIMWGWTGWRDCTAWHRGQSQLKSLRTTYGILGNGHNFWTHFRGYQRLGQCMFLSKLKWQSDLIRCLDIPTLVVTEENLELALQVFAMSHRIQVLDFGLGLNPSHLPNGMTRNMKIRRLHLSKSVEDAHLKKVWMAASNVVVHNIGLLSWQIVRNWNVLEDEVFAGGWELLNGLDMNRQAVDEKYFKFLQDAFWNLYVFGWTGYMKWICAKLCNYKRI